MHLLAFVALMVSCVAGLALHTRFLRELRLRHADIWESLGRPTLIMNNSISNGLAVLRFLWRRDYESIDDPEFVRLARRLRIFNIAHIALFLLIVLSFFMGILLEATRTI